MKILHRRNVAWHRKARNVLIFSSIILHGEQVIVIGPYAFRLPSRYPREAECVVHSEGE